MKASENAHDWHCEDHDTYGWMGEACPMCPKARGKTEVIEQLKAGLDQEQRKAGQEMIERLALIEKVQQLEAEVRRLREALEARRDWFAAQLNSASKGNFSEWDRHTLQEECDAADEALSLTKNQGRPMTDELKNEVLKLLRSYRLTMTEDGEGNGYPLVDAVTHPGDVTIARGIEELEYLAEDIANMVKEKP